MNSNQCVKLPDALDDITAAAIANHGMPARAALVERARLVSGETVLVNGATGAAGRLAVQLAKYLGAGKVMATGRNTEEPEEVKEAWSRYRHSVHSGRAVHIGSKGPN